MYTVVWVSRGLNHQKARTDGNPFGSKYYMVEYELIVFYTVPKDCCHEQNYLLYHQYQCYDIDMFSEIFFAVLNTKIHPSTPSVLKPILFLLP